MGRAGAEGGVVAGGVCVCATGVFRSSTMSLPSLGAQFLMDAEARR